MSCHLTATLKSLRQSILVIGYGNPLRRDDGVGQQIAQEVAGWGMSNVEVITVRQLTPELMEQLAEVDVVIFIDAYLASENQDIQVYPLKPAQFEVTSGDWSEPQGLLAMTQTAHGHRPQAWWVMVPGANFELGEGFSSTAQRGVEAALQEIEYLMKSARSETCVKR